MDNKNCPSTIISDITDKIETHPEIPSSKSGK